MNPFKDWTMQQVEEYNKVWSKVIEDISTPPKPITEDAVEDESKLHRKIIEWCDSQWPRWKYVHARMDRKSTIGNGVADFVIFGPHPLCIVVECKKKDGKLSQDQQCWAAEMKMLGWQVEVVRSLGDFVALTI